MALPQDYVKQMRELLGDEAEAFLASYGEPKRTAIRLNGLKEGTGGEAIVGGRDAVPWAKGAYYTDENERPGKHPYYYAGLYYIQEPSAMLPAELLDPQPGHRVLDLCAAPGGKSTQLAAKLGGTGLLVTNDLAADRTKALAKNIERAGIVGAIVTNESPARLAAAFGASFDRVLVDAPCSGEGMFRKDEDMIRQWNASEPARYASMQDEIMREAAKLVAPGGRIVYSTCTFSPVENEGTIARFLAAHLDFAVVNAASPAEWGFAPGRPDWLTPAEAEALGTDRAAQLAGTIRLWPHRVRGEGHFAALLERTAEEALPVVGRPEFEGTGFEGLDVIPDVKRPDVQGSGFGASDVQWVYVEQSDAEGPNAEQHDAERPNGERPNYERPNYERPEPKRNPKREQPGAGKPPLKDKNRGRRGSERRESDGRQSRKTGQAERDGGDAEALARFAAFVRETLPEWSPPGPIRVNGDYVYAVPDAAIDTAGLRLVREGWLLGRATRHRFEPSQALAMGLAPRHSALSLQLREGDEDAIRYLKGETLQPDAARVVGSDGHPAAMRGWTLVCLDGYPLGWGRWEGALLKNELLPGWRQL